MGDMIQRSSNLRKMISSLSKLQYRSMLNIEQSAFNVMLLLYLDVDCELCSEFRLFVPPSIIFFAHCVQLMFELWYISS